MKISARLTVACFCAALIINPIVLLSLFSQAANEAVSGIVSVWDSAAVEGVAHTIDEWRDNSLEWIDYVAADLVQAETLNRNKWAPLVARDDEEHTFAKMMIKELGDAQSRILRKYVTQDFMYAFGASPGGSSAATFSLVLAERVVDPDLSLLSNSAAANLYKVVASPAELSNSNSTDVFESAISATDAAAAYLILANASLVHKSAFSLGKYASSLWCTELAAAVGNSAVQLDNKKLRGLLAGAVMSWSTWAIVPLDNTRMLLLLGTPPESASVALSCPQAALSSIQILTVLNTSMASNSPVSLSVAASPILGNIMLTVGTAPGVALGPFNVLLKDQNASIAEVQPWVLQTLMNVASVPAGISLVLPQPYAVFVGCWDAAGAGGILSCSGSSAVNAPCQQAAALPIGSVTAARFPISAAGTPAAHKSVFLEDQNLFLTLRPLFEEFALPPSTNTSTAASVVLTSRLFLGIVLNSGTSRDLLSDASSKSVIMSVTFTAFVFVVTLTILHFMFHPLKVIGTLLRCCADIRLHDMETQAPSFIDELFRLQQAVDQLIRRIRVIGKYMPDKSQLQSVLMQDVDLRSFDETPIRLSPTGAGKVGGPSAGKSKDRFLGSIAHSVTVRLEYRSRRKPEQGRESGDTAKTSIFEFVYSAQDKLHHCLLEQCRSRLRERVGEALCIYDKGSPQRSIPVQECTLLRTDEDVLDAIERCSGTHNNVLYLMVIKVAEKNFVAWLKAALTIADFAAVMNAGVYLLSLSSVDTTSITSSDTLADTVAVSRAGMAIVCLCAFRMVGNTLGAVYLVRMFSKLYEPFGSWVSTALTESMVVALLSSASITNLSLLFSHTRLTSGLRFNAPSVEAFHHRLHRWASVSILFNEILPMALCTFAAAQMNGSDVNTTFGILLPAITIAIYAFENYFENCLRRIRVALGAQDGFGTPLSRRGSVSTPVPIAEDSTIAAFEAPFLAKKGRSLVDDDSDDGIEMSGTVAAFGATSTVADFDDIGLSPSQAHFTASSSANGPPEPQHSLYLGLSKKVVTVLRISLHNAAAHFDGMDSVEIQSLCASFLAAVFNENKAFGGIVLSVSNSDVTLGFNCHHVQHNHFEKALGCYFAVSNTIHRNVLQWCVDDRSSPKVRGAIVTGGKYVIGFAGSGEARTFQLLARAKRELEHISRLGEFYHISLACNEGGALALEQKQAAGEKFTPHTSFCGTDKSTAVLSSYRDSDSFTPLMARLIDVVVDQRFTHRAAAFSTAARLERNRRSAARPTKREVTKMFELLWEEGCQPMVHSSRTALAFLDHLGKEALSGSSETPLKASGPTPSRVNFAAVPAAPVSASSLIREHLALFPRDTVMTFVLRRAMSSTNARCCSPLGVDVVVSEVRDTLFAVNTDAGGKTHMSASTSVFSRMCAADEYVVYFTDL